MIKTVVVGHGLTPIGKGWGPRIDASDVVVRMWDNHWQNVQDYGTKYTVGYFELSPKQWTKFSTLNVNTPERGWVAGMLKPTPGVELPLHTKCVSMGRWITRGQELGGVGATGRLKLTRGCAAAAWALETFSGQLTLVGFDNVYYRAALPPKLGWPKGYPHLSSPLKDYKGGGTKYHNHDYVNEGDLLWDLAARYGREIAHAQDIWYD